MIRFLRSDIRFWAFPCYKSDMYDTSTRHCMPNSPNCLESRFPNVLSSIIVQRDLSLSSQRIFVPICSYQQILVTGVCTTPSWFEKFHKVVSGIILTFRSNSCTNYIHSEWEFSSKNDLWCYFNERLLLLQNPIRTKDYIRADTCPTAFEQDKLQTLALHIKRWPVHQLCM